MKRGDGMPAANEDRDDLVVDAADALSLNQRVQWAQYEKLATPASRRALDLAGAAAAGEAPQWRRRSRYPLGRRWCGHLDGWGW